jgi:hypothetical protein
MWLPHIAFNAHAKSPMGTGMASSHYTNATHSEGLNPPQSLNQLWLNFLSLNSLEALHDESPLAFPIGIVLSLLLHHYIELLATCGR